MFAPILIWVVALGIPIVSRVSRRSDAILGSALIVGLVTMPLFYHFELNEVFAKVYNITNQWGLVDSLEGAIAALAVSLLCFGIANRNYRNGVRSAGLFAHLHFYKTVGLACDDRASRCCNGGILSLLFC